MDHWIEHPPEPRELILAWQAPSASTDRIRWAVGRLWRDADGLVFDYFEGRQFADRNLGRSLEDLRAAGYGGYPAFDLKKRPAGGYREHVLGAFQRRLPPASRTDFADYLTHFRISPGARMSPLALLAATEARLPSDGFSLINPLDPEASCVELVFEIAGFRHQLELPQVEIGDGLTLQTQPDNPHDPMAVRVLVGGQLIGYVNRLQAQTVGAWLETRSVNGWIVRLNGRPESPRAFGFLEVRPASQAVAA